MQDILPNQPDPQQEPPIVPDTVPTTPPSTSTGPARSTGRKIKLIIFISLIVLVLAMISGYLVRSSKRQTVIVKKDISYLTYGFRDSGNLTPLYPTQTVDTNNGNLIAAQMFEGLVKYEKQTKIVPLLATSWSNPNNTTWIFDLRHGVKFHSGRIMTADDVKYSLDYAVAHQGNNNRNTNLALASTIKQVEVVNPYQIKITTDGPDPVLLNRLTFLYILDSKATLGDPNAGTGPYIVKTVNTDPSVTFLNLAAFDGYWGGHVYTRSVHIEAVGDDDQLVAGIINGRFDIAGDLGTKEHVAKIKNSQLISVPDLGVTYLQLNLEKAGSPLQSLAARQAAAYALDIPAILKAGGGISGAQVNQLIPPAIPGHDPSIRNIPYDPAKAKQLLSTVPNAAAPLVLSYAGSGSGDTEITKQLNAVGFNIKPVKTDGFDAFVNKLIAGEGDIFWLSYTTNTLDGLDIMNNTVSGTANYSSDEIARLTEQASSTIDPTARIAILQEMEQYIDKNVPTIPLYSKTRNIVLVKPYHVEIDLPSTGIGVYFWKVYQK